MIIARLGRSGRGLSLAMAVVATGLLAGCATNRSGSDPMTTGSVPKGQVAADEWTRRYQATPDDPNVALGFAEVLRRDGRPQQAVEVLQRTLVQNPKNGVVASAYGKALAEAGAFEEALKVVRDANSPRTPDWRLTSAEAAIQDQLGHPAEARRLYDLALKLSPDEPSVLNNLGLSYVLTNELPAAEKVLRRAAAPPRRCPRPPEPGPRRRPSGAVRRSRQDRFRGPSPGTGEDQRRLSARHAQPAQHLEAAEAGGQVGKERLNRSATRRKAPDSRSGACRFDRGSRAAGHSAGFASENWSKASTACAAYM